MTPSELRRGLRKKRSNVRQEIAAIRASVAVMENAVWESKDVQARIFLNGCLVDALSRGFDYVKFPIIMFHVLGTGP